MIGLKFLKDPDGSKISSARVLCFLIVIVYLVCVVYIVFGGSPECGKGEIPLPRTIPDIPVQLAGLAVVLYGTNKLAAALIAKKKEGG